VQESEKAKNHCNTKARQAEKTYIKSLHSHVEITSDIMTMNDKKQL